MSENWITIKEVQLNNNCPECYNNSGLHLTFKQKFLETRFYKSITSEVDHEIFCKNCNTIIYPVRWKKDIESVFEYHQKAFVPKKSSIKLKKVAWIVITAIGLVVVAVITLAILS
jgi:DNA-directed RNA polymerase subunit M/transcription elongation factor TFIIS